MSITLRPLGEGDAPRTAALLNLDAAEPATQDEIRERLRTIPPGRLSLRLGAFDGAGRQVGYAHALRDEWMSGGLFWLHVVVDPAARRRGIGARLHEAAQSYAREHGATALRGEVRDHLPGALAFAERQGYRVDRHIFESTLDLAAFDERRSLPVLESCQSAGIRFFSLAEVGDTTEARRRLYDVERVCARDIPGGSEAAIRPFEVFVRQVCESQHYLPDGQIVAADGERWIGLAAILRTSIATEMYNAITGVLPAYRGRGVATALKLVAIRAARRHGAAALRTKTTRRTRPCSRSTAGSATVRSPAIIGCWRRWG
jgi:GNAT superfamily N-acetyltransferase